MSSRSRLTTGLAVVCAIDLLVGTAAAIRPGSNRHDGRETAAAVDSAEVTGESATPTETTVVLGAAPDVSTPPETTLVPTTVARPTTTTAAAPVQTTPPATTPVTTPATTATRPAPPPSTTGLPGDGTCAGTIFALVNQARSAAGAGALTDDRAIQHVPLDWSQHMADTTTMAHNPDYKEQIEAVHPDMAGWSENVGFYGGGGNTPAQTGKILFDLWMDSPGHRKNILFERSTHTAIACVIGGGRTWATQNFWNR